MSLMGTNMKAKKALLRSRHRRERVATQAKYVQFSQLASALTSCRKLEDKHLQSYVNKLEVQKRVRNSEMFQRQREFFIEKLFDSDNKLRFAKVRERRMSTASGQVVSDSADTLQESDKDHIKSRKGRLSDYIFLDKLVDEHSVNSRLIAQKEKELTARRQYLSQVGERMKQNKTSPATMLSSNGENTAPRRSTLPLMLQNATKDKHMGLPRVAAEQEGGILVRSKTTHFLITGNTSFSSISPRAKHERKPRQDYIREVSIEKKNSPKLSEKTKSKFSLLPQINNVSAPSLVHDPQGSGYSPGGGHSHHTQENGAVRESNRFTAKQDHALEDPASEKIFEKVLVKISASLPAHLLLKTSAQEQSVADILGYIARNRRLLDRERQVTSNLDKQDPRFQKLMEKLQNPLS